MIGIEPVRIAVWIMPVEKALGRCLRGEICAVPIAESGGRLGRRGQGDEGDGESWNDETKTANG